MKITVYDGADTIGGNKIHIEDNGKGLFLDFGLNFAHSGMYFKEFIKMRPTRGLNDPFEMGLLPKVNTYRGDLITDEINRASLKNIPVDAILLTHAHMDHYGMIGYLDFSIPLVASPETFAILKAYQDAGRSEIGSSAIYSMERGKRIEDFRVLSNIDIKTHNVKKPEKVEEKLDALKEHYRIRPLFSTIEIPDKLLEFMHYQSDKIKIAHFEKNMKIGNIGELPFKIRAYPVDHSVYGATAYVIEGNKTIAYTGDIRLHGENGYKTLEFAKNARDAEILITEGTRVSPDKKYHYVSEKDVYKNSLSAVEDEKGLIIADFSARNFERLNIFSHIADKTGRVLVITEKDAYAVESLSHAGININIEHVQIYKKLTDHVEWWQEYIGREKIRKKESENGFKKKSKMWENKLIDPHEIHTAPERYILAFSLYDMPNMMDIKTQGGMYLYSSTEAFNEEMELDFITLHNWLRRYEIKSVGFHMDNGKPIFEEGYHASGHASQEDLKKVIEIIDPDYIIPVHTENPLWFRKNFDNTKIIRNGESRKF